MNKREADIEEKEAIIPYYYSLLSLRDREKRKEENKKDGVKQKKL